MKETHPVWRWLIWFVGGTSSTTTPFLYHASCTTTPLLYHALLYYALLYYTLLYYHTFAVPHLLYHHTLLYYHITLQVEEVAGNVAFMGEH